MDSHEIISTSANGTYCFGKILGALLQPGDLLAFTGDLGAGKTCCIQGIAEGLGVTEHGIVTSPTFTLIQEYQGRLPIYHFDVYRLTDENDLYDLGYEEYFYGDGVTVIEWAERIPSFLTEARLDIHLHIEPDSTRRIQLQARGDRHYHDLLKSIEQSA
ncbi:tRNA (adenosine(37)-N6)-threonylcarbamoyltransferase complex ATPase subunit type 1 TsaE [candidate division KSB3 bacterium]|uniref:tRNA threonylcarbamoyladenosine biosynthesis protein TsaE n=1 Tax=candidate division KSB3 bacterium TaxID=2044937 RepID=A0A2G6KHB7_9BACT|nr:MAG: tRNA (adenosine(37)-N6)-threonylcarbamoyltransferase complex ATPase subunit type 1 TsaE [candidate division KSB3 bacterium]